MMKISWIILGVFLLIIVGVQVSAQSNCDICVTIQNIIHALRNQPVMFAENQVLRNRIVIADGGSFNEEFLPMPRGRCGVTVSMGNIVGQGGNPQWEMAEAKDALQYRNAVSCLQAGNYACSASMFFDGEYSMLRIKILGGDLVNHASVSYTCNTLLDN